MLSPQLLQDIKLSISLALKEDLGQDFAEQTSLNHDITAALIPEDENATATVITRENCIMCGVAWVNEVFRQLDEISNKTTKITWFVKDGDQVKENSKLFTLTGNARTLLTGERTALNFVQSLSATATITQQYVNALTNSQTKLLDTRKTVPGLRSAQKYAVLCGGGVNHRIGLFDAFLIKENHINACKGITNAVSRAKNNHPDKKVEVEVESLTELKEALTAGADIIMLDNFSHEMIEQAVIIRDQLSDKHTKHTQKNSEQSISATNTSGPSTTKESSTEKSSAEQNNAAKNNSKAKLEVSGNMSLTTIKTYAKAGVDFISVGALTKHINAIDLSMRFSE